MRKQVFLLVFVLIPQLTLLAQEQFTKYSYKPKIHTLSNGKYQEFFDNDDIVQIGLVLFNTQTNKIVGYVKNDTSSYKKMEAELTSRWLSLDPKTEEYPSWSPYNFVLNNPIKFVDPKGEDVYLIIWASQDGHIGHAGIAVDNYKTVDVKDKNGNTVMDKDGNPVTEQVKDGTVTYRDLWPGGEGANKSNATDDISSVYNNQVTTLDKIKNTDVTGSEGYAPDAVVQMKTDSKTDAVVSMALDAHQKVNDKYNGANNNCSDFAKSGVEYAAPYGSQLGNTDERMGSRNVTTPNQLYKATVRLPNASVVKNPGSKVNNRFIDAVSNGSNIIRKVAEKKME
jgi:RHS repeat-associated protein